MYTEVVNSFLELINKMNSNAHGLDAARIEEAMSKVCCLLNVSLVHVSVYPGLKAEQLNNGENHFICKNGESDDDEYIQRYVAENSSVIIYRFLHKKGTPPWNDFDKGRLKLISDIVFVFNSRERMRQLAERYSMYDQAGYKNLHMFGIYLDMLSLQGKLNDIAVIYFNLKHFQSVNSQFGRKIGDIVMRSYIDMLTEAAGEDGTVCRIGGDNFILATDISRLDGILDILSGKAVTYDNDLGERVMVSASAGVLTIDSDFAYSDMTDVMDKVAPTAQVAKSGRTGDVVFYSNELIENRNKRLYVQQQFPYALENEEFLVYYQPKINVLTGKMIGAEALCRWCHKGKIIPPMEFIPVLEQDMAICKLDFYMLDHVCRTIRRWLDEGKEVVRISANLSRKHMMDVDLLDHIMEIINKNNVPHKYIEIELTETTTDVEFRDLKRVVRGLQDAGVCTSVDDFGIGYSSLNLIKELPWNVLKIDRSILPVDNKDERSVMFKYVVAMAKEMGLECIAEGVETEAQVEVLKKNGCDLAQGFFFDRPLPLEEFEKRLDKKSKTII